MWELYDTSRGMKTSLDELACRPGVLASSCADWRPNSTSESPHVQSVSQPCPQSPSPAENSAQAAEDPLLQPRSQMRNPRAADSRLRGRGPRLWASGEGVSLPGCAAQVPTEHTTARPCAPSPRPGAAPSPQPPPRAPALRRLWPGCWNGRAAPAAPRLRSAVGVRRGERASKRPPPERDPAIADPNAVPCGWAEVGGTPPGQCSKDPVTGEGLWVEEWAFLSVLR